MIERCYSPATLATNPTYDDKIVSDNWKYFTKFSNWMTSQNWEGMELDKDMILLGNREYSADTCWFVPQRINLVLGTSDGKRGEYMLGVCLHSTARHKFQARCGKKYLGLFDDEASAHRAWQKAKAQDVLDVIDWWHFTSEVSHTFNQKIAENLIYISGKIIEDYRAGRETVNLVYIKEN
jgi:hypothetical protein